MSTANSHSHQAARRAARELSAQTGMSHRQAMTAVRRSSPRRLHRVVLEQYAPSIPQGAYAALAGGTASAAIHANDSARDLVGHLLALDGVTMAAVSSNYAVLDTLAEPGEADPGIRAGEHLLARCTSVTLLRDRRIDIDERPGVGLPALTIDVAVAASLLCASNDLAWDVHAFSSADLDDEEAIGRVDAIFSPELIKAWGAMTRAST